MGRFIQIYEQAVKSIFCRETYETCRRCQNLDEARRPVRFCFEVVSLSDMHILAITRGHTRSIMLSAKFCSLAGSGKRVLLLKQELDNMALRRPLSAHVLVWNALSTWVQRTCADRH